MKIKGVMPPQATRYFSWLVKSLSLFGSYGLCDTDLTQQQWLEQVVPTISKLHLFHLECTHNSFCAITTEIQLVLLNTVYLNSGPRPTVAKTLAQ